MQGELKRNSAIVPSKLWQKIWIARLVYLINRRQNVIGIKINSSLNA